MKSSIIFAWLVGEAIVTYRCVKNQSRPPVPGELLASSGLFILLAGLAEIPSAATMAALLAWGMDIAALLNLVQNPHLFGPTSHTPAGTTSNSLAGQTPAQRSPGGVGLATT